MSYEQSEKKKIHPETIWWLNNTTTSKNYTFKRIYCAHDICKKLFVAFESRRKSRKRIWKI